MELFTPNPNSESSKGLCREDASNSDTIRQLFGLERRLRASLSGLQARRCAERMARDVGLLRLHAKGIVDADDAELHAVMNDLSHLSGLIE